MAVGFGQLGGKALCIVAVRLGAVQQDDIRLADAVQLCDDTALGVEIRLPRQVGNGAVRRYDEAYRGVLPDDAAGAGFGGQVKRDLVVEPGTLCLLYTSPSPRD